MKRTILLIIKTIIIFQTFSQTVNNKTVLVEGYYFFSFNYNSIQNYYSFDDNFFIDAKGKRYSVIQLSHARGLLDCCSKKIQKQISLEIKLSPANFWIFNITEEKDSSSAITDMELWSCDCFFQDSNGKLFMGMKVKGKAYIANNLCNKYGNNLKLQSICINKLKTHFLLFTMGIRKGSIEKAELTKLKIKKSSLNKIPFIACY